MRKLSRLLRGIWSIFYNFIICYFVDRSRRVAFVNSVLSFDERKALGERFPSRDFSEIFPSHDSLELRFDNYFHRSGNVLFTELALLGAIARTICPKIVFEFGTFDGNTTLQLALNTPEDAVIYTLDLPTNSQGTRLRLDSGDRQMMGTVQVGERFIGTSAEKKIHQILSDSAAYDYSSLRGKVDLVFVDGSHSYEYLDNDTKHALELLDPGGVIVWHDYMVWNDVTTYLNQTSKRLRLVHIKGTSLVVYRAF